MNQGETSSGPSIHPLKRRRGRPPKDPSLKRPPPGGHAPPDLDGFKHYLPSRADRTDKTEFMAGQAVTGVVEATLDAGYLLNVRIGNSPTNFRGIVFKPGHYVPVTAENDVAPHLQMIRRNDFYTPTAENQKLAIQTVPPPKRKYKSRRAVGPSVHPVGVRGNVIPVVLQPVNFPNGLPNSNQTPPRAGQVLDFGDKDVHMVEPLSMLPPDRSIPAGQIFLGGQPHASQRVPPQVSEQNENGPFNEGEKLKPMMGSSDVENTGSSETSDSQTENGKEALKSLPAEETGNGNEHFSEPLENVSVTKPVFNYGPGRLTELLQAVQEKENQLQISEQPIPDSKVELCETMTTETDPRNEASVP